MYTDLPNLIYKACETVNTNICLFGLIVSMAPTDELGFVLYFRVYLGILSC